MTKVQVDSNNKVILLNSKALAAQEFTGIPREVTSSGAYSQPNASFTFTIPDNATILTGYALLHAFYVNTHITKFDFNNIATIDSFNCYQMCRDATGLTSVNMKNVSSISGTYAFYFTFYNCTALSSVDTSSLTSISGDYAFYDTFFQCPITTIDLSKLETVSGNYAMAGAFYGTKLSELYFNSLKTISGNVFYNILGGVSGCTLHFPSNMESTISGLTGYPTFGGSNVTISFDLPATS